MVEYGLAIEINLKIKVIAFIGVFILSFAPFNVLAEVNEPSIEKIELVLHDLDCGDVFLCPKEMQSRINFWIQVYRLWGRQDRVLHDARFPSRVYGVFHNTGFCRRGEAMAELKVEFNKIRRNLLLFAEVIETEGVDNSLYKKSSIGRLFPDLSASKLREAAEHIRCQAGNRESFISGLQKSSRYENLINQVFSDYNLPEDLRYLPLVESSFNPKAYSHAGAAGIWQIMPATGTAFGLKINKAVDERFDPFKSSLAAAKYFSSSFKRLTKVAEKGGYPSNIQALASFLVTSYNYGVGGMQKAIAEHGTDFSNLLEEYTAKDFGVASQNFYAGFLAARHVAKKAAFYFPNLKYSQPHKVEVLTLDKAVSMPLLLASTEFLEKQLKTLNPSLLPDVWNGTTPIPKSYQLRLPHGNNNGTTKNTLITLVNGLDSFAPELGREIQYDLSVKQDGARYFIHVLPPETFEHYSSWVDEKEKPNVRRFNHFATAQRLSHGSIVRLPLLTKSDALSFEQKRKQFHQGVIDQYFNRFQIADARSYEVKANESIWQVAMQEQVPIWLLLNLNPQLDESNINKLLIPEVKPRS